MDTMNQKTSHINTNIIKNYCITGGSQHFGMDPVDHNQCFLNSIC